MAIDINAFIDPAEFKKTTGDILRDLRNSKVAPGCERIYTAGEKEFEARKYRTEHGCPVPPTLQKVMSEYRDRWNLDFVYPWD